MFETIIIISVFALAGFAAFEAVYFSVAQMRSGYPMKINIPVCVAVSVVTAAVLAVLIRITLQLI